MTSARQQMIDAAERIVAERGIGAMSLREVQSAAGQRNKSAAQYHFGSRDGLVEAVVTARMGPINERRLALLAALGEEPPLRAVVAALVEPLAEATLGRPGSCWARFLLQGWVDPAVAEGVRRSFEASSFRTVRGLLVEAAAHVPEPLRARRVDQAVAFVVMSLAAAEAAAAGGRRSHLSPAATTADLVDACCGLLRAPTSPTTEHELDGRHARPA